MRFKCAGLSLLTFALLLLSNGCTTNPQGRITQYSTLEALQCGVYDGTASCGEILGRGDTGIGTFEHLDGEMIVLDGKVYQARVNGEVKEVSPELKTPFAVLVEFRADEEIEKKGMNKDSLEKVFTASSRSPNFFHAIKLHGRFKKMVLRSVPPQKKPYPTLAEAAKEQRVFKFENIEGTLVGFRCPSYAKGINLPGNHLHFLSDDRKSGGHVLDFEIDGDLRLELMSCRDFLLLLPKEGGFADAKFGIDRSAELKQIEK